jgi:hypothetical protein
MIHDRAMQGDLAPGELARTYSRRVFASLDLPIPTRSEANAHEHYRERQKRAKSQRGFVAGALRRFQRPPAGTRLVVVLTRVSPRALDSDNLVGSCKHVRDGVADWLEVDDRAARVTWHVEQAKGPVAVRVLVRARDERDDALDAALAAALHTS